MDRREVGWENGDWMHLTRDRNQWRDLMHTIMNIRVPQEAGYLFTS
jgi:hypothetical protein